MRRKTGDQTQSNEKSRVKKRHSHGGNLIEGQAQTVRNQDSAVRNAREDQQTPATEKEKKALRNSSSSGDITRRRFNTGEIKDEATLVFGKKGPHTFKPSLKPIIEEESIEEEPSKSPRKGS
jgi:hypothetical protein